MPLSIRPDNFGPEILDEKKMVLLGCFHRGPEFVEQKEVLEGVAKTFNGELKVCLLNVDSFDALREEFEVEGTPTFLIFAAGKEKGRILGKTDKATLIDFVRGTIIDFKT